MQFNWVCFLIGIAVMCVLTIFTRWLFYCLIAKKSLKWNMKNNNILFFVVSPDYICAQMSKNALCIDSAEESENDRKHYIENYNTINLIISIVVAILSYVAMYLGNNELKNILCACVAFRILSRTIEINLSFIKDISEEENRSGIKSGKRVVLAIKSLIEEMVLFAAMYIWFLSDGEYLVLQSLTMGLYSFTLDNVAETCKVIVKFISAYQKMCSVCLISLCIASYASGAKKGNA